MENQKLFEQLIECDCPDEYHEKTADALKKFYFWPYILNNDKLIITK